MMTTKMVVFGSVVHKHKEVSSETSLLSNQLWTEIRISPPMPRATNPEEKYFLH